MYNTTILHEGVDQRHDHRPRLGIDRNGVHEHFAQDFNESSLLVVDISPPSEKFQCDVFTRSVCSMVTRYVSMKTSPSFSVSFLSSPQAFWALVVEAQISEQFSPLPRNSLVPRVRGVARLAPHRRPGDCRVPPVVLPRFLARCSRSHIRP